MRTGIERRLFENGGAGPMLLEDIVPREDSPIPTPTLADKGKALVVLPDGTLGFSEVGGLPLLTPFWSSLGLPEVGCLNLSLDNGQIPYDAFPVQVWDKINLAHTENTGAVTTEAAWLAEVALHGTCGRYALGEDFFRVPLLRQRASFGFPDAGAGATHGAFLPDQFQGHSFGMDGGIRNDQDILRGTPDRHYMSSHSTMSSAVFTRRDYEILGIAGGASRTKITSDGINGEPRVGNDTQGKLVIYTPMLKMYGSIDDPGVLNAANVVQMITGKLDASRFEVSQQIMHVRDEKPNGTAGGTFTAGAWRTRDLNTVKMNTISGASLSGNQITLPPGIYDITARAPAYGTGGHNLRFSNNSETISLLGAQGRVTSGYGTQTDSWIFGRVTITTVTTFTLSHLAGATSATSGLGMSAGLGIPEIYAEVIIRRLA